MELSSGAKALVKGVRKAGDLAKKVRDATDDIGSIKGALKAGKASLTETISRQVVAADGGSPNIDGPAVREALDDLGADTASAKTTAIQALHSVDDGAADLAKLSSREQAKVASRLYRTGNTDDAIEFAKQLEDAEDLRYLAEEDVGTLEQLADWHQNPGMYRVVDSDLGASDFITVARSAQDISETSVVVRTSTPDNANVVRWLEKGQYSPGSGTSSGWEYLRARHIRGENLGGKDATTFWPVGQTVKGRPLPGTMSRNDVRAAIYEAVKKYETTNQDAFYYSGYSDDFVQRTGVSQVRVVIRDGKIRTAWPTDGDKVRKYISENDVGWQDGG